MIITINEQSVVVPGLPEFKSGETYSVSDELGAALIERGQAVAVESEKSAKPKTRK